VTGWGILDFDDGAVRAALGRLHDQLDVRVGARIGWLAAWREVYRDWRPWLIVLRDEAGDLRAAAPLAVRRRAGMLRVVALGDTELDRSPVVHRTEADGVELADAVADALHELDSPWRLDLRQLPTGSAFTAELASQLEPAKVLPGADRPIVALPGARQPREVVTLNLHKAERRARNRIARAGLGFEESWLVGAEAIAWRIPEVRSVHRERDIQLRNRSGLDSPREGRFWDALIRRHLPDLELLEIRLASELAAYLLWIRDGSWRYVLDNRVSPRWAQFSAGLIANNVALRRAALDEQVEVLDWGSGVQRYKLQSATEVIHQEVLFAWSSRAARGAFALEQEIRRHDWMATVSGWGSPRPE
jgi:Acetyltransferase (GNAT) domain